MDSQTIDLDALDTVKGAEAGHELELRAPDGKELPGRIRIRGFDSEVYQEAHAAQQRRLMEKGATGRVPTARELEAESLDLSATLVLGWTCPFKVKGEPLPYSATNARVLLQRWPWIREQVERAARTRANFLPGSSTS